MNAWVILGPEVFVNITYQMGPSGRKNSQYFPLQLFTEMAYMIQSKYIFSIINTFPGEIVTIFFNVLVNPGNGIKV